MSRLIALVLACLFSAVAATTQAQQIITTVAGGGPNNMPALLANISPLHVAVDSAGNTYIGAPLQNRVFKVDATGQLTVVAGSGTPGFGGDGGPATSASLNFPYGVAVDASGNLYIADYYNYRVRRVDTNGVITTVAGNGTIGFSGDGGPATSASLATPTGVAVDGSGNLYIADYRNSRIRKVDPSGIITTVAGNGTGGFSGDGGPATSAGLNSPFGVAVDGSGNLYVADTGNYRVRRVAPNGIITSVAGNGTQAFSGDGGPATSASLVYATGLAVDGSGNLYIADRDSQRIRRVDTNGVITTVAGNGTAGSSGDGGPATSASLSYPNGVAVDGGGNLYIADSSNNPRIRRVGANGIITAFAGSGNSYFSGDGWPATSASLANPTAVAVDGSGNLYIADRRNSRIRRVGTNGGITTFAGNGTDGFGGDGGLATSASLRSPTGVAVDGSGNLYIAAYANNRVRRVDTNGVITTFAGGIYGFGGDGGLATSASLRDPTGVAVDGSGNLYIADQNNQRIRRVDPNGIITTVAGNGTYGFSGDGGQATSASLANPSGVAVDGSGNLYIADQRNYRIRRVDPDGVITTFAGGTYGFSGDGGLATSASLANPSGVAVDGSGNLYIADSYNQRIRCVDPDGIITTVAGNGTYGFSGDGGPATSASLGNPSGVGVDGSGNLYIADSSNNRIRKVSFDTSPPAISITVPADGASYLLGSTVVAEYSCSDAVSGVASCTGTVPSGSPIDTASVGTKSFSVTAADNAGNSATSTRHYSVIYRFSGFFVPVGNLPMLNAANAGNTIPVKFSLGGNQGAGILASGYPTSRPIACNGTPSGIEQTAAGELDYRSDTAQYNFRWQTEKAWAGTCRQFILRLIDGTEHVANFQFK